MRVLMVIARRAGRTLLLLFCAGAGTILLVRLAPGFFSDEREMDGKYAQGARLELQAEDARYQTASAMMIREVDSWMHGDLGESRQYHVPVAGLIAPRIGAVSYTHLTLPTNREV